jgi:peptide/nickel transport system permease protein
MIPTFVGITFVTFAVMRLAPGDPLAMMADPGSAGFSAEARDALRSQLGLDRPIPEQYARWFGRVVTLDFGRSSQDGRWVLTKIAEALPKTLLLSVLALLVSYLVAVPLGVFAAVRRGTVAERALTVGLFALYSLPSFWVAVLLILLFCRAQTLDWFPMQGLTSDDFDSLSAFAKLKDLVWHLILPVICLSYASLATVTRYLRAGMLEVIRQDFIRTARAKGLPERAVIFRHALRNSLIPIITLLGVTLPALMGGSVVVERIFGINGMGLLGLQAILSRDYPMVMGITTLVALLTMLCLLASDLLYAAVDPRIGHAEPR